MKLYSALCITMVIFIILGDTEAFLFKTTGIESNIDHHSQLAKRGGGSTVVEFKRNPDGIKCVLDCIDGLEKYKDVLGRTQYRIGVKDSCVNITEVQNAKDHYLKDAEKLVTSIVKDNQGIMWDCDYDTTARSSSDKAKLEAGCISREDMEMAVDHCISKTDELKMLKEKVCDRCRTQHPNL